MFRLGVEIGLGVVALVLVGHYLVCGPKRLAVADRAALVPRLSGWERLLHVVALVSFLVLAVTGLGSVLAGKDRMHGWVLFVHGGIAPLFALSLAAMAVLYAESHRWVMGLDCSWMKSGGGYCRSGTDVPAGRFDAGQKVLFWLALALGWVVIVSALLGMMKAWGTDTQHFWQQCHKASTLAITLVALVHGYFTTLAKPGTWRVLLTGRVSTAWAARHHSQWKTDESGGKS